MPLAILLADDHAIFRRALRLVLEREGFTVIGEAADGAEAVRLAWEFHPDVAVLDLAMPVMNGIHAAHEMLQSSPNTRTILLTVHKEFPYIREALRAGVAGYVLKRRAGDELIRAIGEVSQGKVYLTTDLPARVVSNLLPETRPARIC